MRRDLSISLLIFALVGLGSWSAKSLGLYDAHWYTDVILHLASGIGFGFIWTALTGKSGRSKIILILGAASAAVLGSFLWELWEFAGWRIIPGRMRDYVPELGDSLVDILCGLAGGVMAGIWKSRCGMKLY
jgi:hypothetical protein